MAAAVALASAMAAVMGIITAVGAPALFAIAAALAMAVMRIKSAKNDAITKKN